MTQKDLNNEEFGQEDADYHHNLARLNTLNKSINYLQIKINKYEKKNKKTV